MREIVSPRVTHPLFSRLGMTVLAAAALLHPSPLTAAGADAQLGPPFLVNEIVDRDQAEPVVAPRPDGGFIAAWKADPLGGSLSGRIVDGSGRPAGPEFPVTGTANGTSVARGLVAMASDASGRFAVVWTRFERELDVQFFDVAGNPAGPPTVVADLDGAEENRFPTATFAPDGRLWVAWAREEVGSTRILVRSFGPDGQSEGEPTELGTTRFFLNPFIAVAAADDGAILASWADFTSQIYVYALRGKLYHPAAGWGDQFTIVSGRNREPAHVRASAAPTSGFALSWEEDFTAYLDLLDGSGAAKGPPRRVSDASESAYTPATAHDGEGNLLVAWTQNQAIHGRCFDPTGAPLGGELTLSADPRFPNTNVAVAGLPSGGFALLWEAGFGDGDGSAILGRFLAAPSPGIVGLTAAHYTATEGDGQAEVSVRRTQGTLGAVSVQYRVRGDSAIAGEDFSAVSGRLTWTDGDDGPRSFTVSVADDARREDEERAVIELSSPGGGAILGRAEATLILRDDDGLARPGAASSQLSAADVECDRQRLAGLAERIDGFDRGLNLALTASGDPFGVLYVFDEENGLDALLSFSANPEETPLLRNPARPQLPTVSLTRDDLASTLIEDATPPASGVDPRWLQVTLDPTLGGGSKDSFLHVDNALLPDEFLVAGQSTDSKPGRGLLPLLQPCHDKLTERDVHVLRVLARTLRAGVGPSQDFLSTILYRGEEPGHYVIEVSSYRFSLVLDLLVRFAADGSLLDGTFRTRDRCPPLRTRGCSDLGQVRIVTVAVTPPLGGPAPIDPRHRIVVGDEVPVERREITVDWRELLAGTTWRKPL